MHSVSFSPRLASRKLLLRNGPQAAVIDSRNPADATTLTRLKTAFDSLNARLEAASPGRTNVFISNGASAYEYRKTGPDSFAIKWHIPGQPWTEDEYFLGDGRFETFDLFPAPYNESKTTFRLKQDSEMPFITLDDAYAAVKLLDDITPELIQRNTKVPL